MTENYVDWLKFKEIVPRVGKNVSKIQTVDWLKFVSGTHWLKFQDNYNENKLI